MRRLAAVAVLAAALAAALAFGACSGGGAVGIDPYTGDDSSVDDYEAEQAARAEEEALERDEWKLAYADAFAAACADVWAGSPDGALYYDDIAYYEGDCDAASDSESAIEDAADYGTVTSIDEAESLGREDGLDEAFDESDLLCWGRECWSRDDFW